MISYITAIMCLPTSVAHFICFQPILFYWFFSLTHLKIPLLRFIKSFENTNDPLVFVYILYGATSYTGLLLQMKNVSTLIETWFA